tara:strand:- start:449 stop:763 length:315 start_codon:yes stop_codon:yes gene_type:complete
VTVVQQDNPNEYRNPRRINDPLILIVWPAIQIAPAIALLSMGMLFKHVGIFALAAFAWFHVLGYVIRHSAPHVVLHKIWTFGVLDMVFKTTATVVDPLKKKYFS